MTGGRWLTAALAASTLLGLTGCGDAGLAGGEPASGRLRVTATTGMIGDLARSIGGDRVEVTTLMGPGVDPHLYKASEGDVARLTGADLILFHGLNLEGRMGEVLGRLQRQGRASLAVGETVPAGRLLSAEEFGNHPDPHIWFDASLWAETIPSVEQALTAADPRGADHYRSRAESHRRELTELHSETRGAIAGVPADRRVLVTAHDAFGYFGRAYDIEVVGLQGMNTAAEYGLRDVQRLVDLITGRRVPAVFLESSVPPRSIEAVIAGCRARGHQVGLGGTLYSDALGEPETEAGSLVGMFRHNVRTIVEALQ
jgi:manganese/zinc/iron transport system substrate-binding protein